LKPETSRDFKEEHPLNIAQELVAWERFGESDEVTVSRLEHP
jgi:hypothetical protein